MTGDKSVILELVRVRDEKHFQLSKISRYVGGNNQYVFRCLRHGQYIFPAMFNECLFFLTVIPSEAYPSTLTLMN